MEPTKKLPLFLVFGASGVGKTAACEVLFRQETDYVVLDSDLLWRDVFDTPEDQYRSFRETWLRMCTNISQIGLPVVLCGCGLPEQFEHCDGRQYFTELHYIALVCDETVLEERMRIGRGIEDEAWLESSRHFNEWLKAHAHETQPPVELLDNTWLTPQETAERIEGWIHRKKENRVY